MRRVLILAAAVPLLVTAAFAVLYFDRVVNAYQYVFEGGTYLNRAFRTVGYVVSKDDPIYRDLVFDSSYDDRRGHQPDFTLPFKRQVTVSASSEQRSAYLGFIDRYKAVLGRFRAGSSPRPDATAFSIMNIVHEQYIRNGRNTVEPDEDTFENELSYRAEDFVFYLVNAKTACGTVGEATVALLRYAGYKARLLRIANSPTSLVANHVFPEFYSEKQRRWVMLDPMINASPRGAEGSLSAFELMDRPNEVRRINRLWGRVGEYDFTLYGPRKVVWYNIRGPVMRLYYYASDPETRRRITLPSR